MNLPNHCPLCNEGSESIIHLLRDCPIAKDLWNSLHPPMASDAFFGNNPMTWIRYNCRNTSPSSTLGINWNTLFSFGIWTLWLHRNNVIFRGKPLQNNLKAETISKAVEFAFLGLEDKHHTHQTTIRVKWNAPLVNWYKVNSDGSSLGDPGLAGGGGLIRNDRGDWTRGYARAIGSTTSAAAELWA